MPSASCSPTRPGFLLSAPLAELLLSLPGYGQVRVGRLLKRCRVSPLKTVGALTERQREEITRALDDPLAGQQRVS